MAVEKPTWSSRRTALGGDLAVALQVADAAALRGRVSGNAPTDAPTFIETQFPVSRLSKESYKERKANYKPDVDGAWQVVGAQAAGFGAGVGGAAFRAHPAGGRRLLRRRQRSL